MLRFLTPEHTNSARDAYWRNCASWCPQKKEPSISSFSKTRKCKLLSRSEVQFVIWRSISWRVVWYISELYHVPKPFYAQFTGTLPCPCYYYIQRLPQVAASCSSHQSCEKWFCKYLCLNPLYMIWFRSFWTFIWCIWIFVWLSTVPK